VFLALKAVAEALAPLRSSPAYARTAAATPAINRPIGQRIAGARPASSECRCQTEPDQRAALGCRQRGIHQLEQAILAEAQVVVERLTEVAEPLPSIGFEHTELETLLT
jgi:hypothetical protein